MFTHMWAAFDFSLNEPIGVPAAGLAAAALVLIVGRVFSKKSANPPMPPMPAVGLRPHASHGSMGPRKPNAANDKKSYDFPAEIESSWR